MKSSRNDRIYLDDIVQEIAHARAFIQSGERDSIMVQYAIIKSLEIIGEAAGSISKELKEQHPDIPWAKIISMRHRLVHEYFGVAMERVWAVVDKELPLLEEQIEAIIRDLESRG